MFLFISIFYKEQEADLLITRGNLDFAAFLENKNDTFLTNKQFNLLNENKGVSTVKSIWNWSLQFKGSNDIKKWLPPFCKLIQNICWTIVQKWKQNWWLSWHFSERSNAKILHQKNQLTSSKMILQISTTGTETNYAELCSWISSSTASPQV